MSGMILTIYPIILITLLIIFLVGCVDTWWSGWFYSGPWPWGVAFIIIVIFLGSLSLTKTADFGHFR